MPLIAKEIEDRLGESRALLVRLGRLLDPAKLKAEIEKRETEAGQPSFWADSSKAKKKSKELNDLKKKLSEYEAAARSLEDLKAHLELAAEVDDPAELKEVENGLAETQKNIA